MVSTKDVIEHDWLDHAVRVGMVAYGLVHLMIAWLAFQLVLGGSKESASSSGALHELAQQPFGAVLVWLAALGMVLLVVWRGLEAAVGHRDDDGGTRARKRLASAGKGVIYAVIGVSAIRVAVGEGSKGGQDSTTAKLMNLPGGQFLVGAVGVAILAYAARQAYRAWTEDFADHLTAEGKRGDTGSAYLLFGKLGYSAKGLAIGVVGVLFVYAAVTHEAEKSGGLDQALQKVLQQPFGGPALIALAIGIACYGLFCLARARHLSR